MPFCVARSRVARFCLFVGFISSLVGSIAGQQAPEPATKSGTVQEGTFDQGTEHDSRVQNPASDSRLQPVAPSAATPDTPAKAPSPAPPGLKLGSGDLIEINVYGVPELSTKARVNNNGDLYLPLVNYLHVADLTVDETQQLIEKQLADGGFVREPHVTVLIDEYSSQGVLMLGEVAKPGVYPIPGDRRLVDMITAAGGLTDKAGRDVTIIHRDEPDKPQIVTLSRALTDNPDSNIPILPGDSVEVHRAPIVYVVGDVGRPSGLLVDNGRLSVLQALALAGGANRTAKLNDSRILRKSSGPNGMTETKVQLKKMLEAKTPDVPLEANDILFIPVSGARVAAARSFEAAMAITTGLAIYAVHP